MNSCRKRGFEDTADGSENGHLTSKERKKQKRGKDMMDKDPFSPVVVNDLREDDGKLGIIEKVTLKNFMCHSNLEFKFGNGPHVHFVVGRNGSGKSAVLNGIILALGGKSTLTGRNTNIKGFIQTGKQVADISVTLSNCGPESYRQEEYGQKITVSRRIASEGTSTYKITAEGGKLVSSKKEELNCILDALNIQVDNPVCILTQEASKSFLESKDPKKKYAFFIKATQLEKIWDQYCDADAKRKDAKEAIKQKIQQLPELKSQVKKCEDQMKRLNSLEELKEKLKSLENEYAWAIVKKEEEKEQQCRSHRDKISKSVEKANSLVTKAGDKVAASKAKLDGLENEIRAIENESDGLKKKYEELCHNCEKYAREIKVDKTKIDRLESAIQAEQSQVDILRKSIEEYKARSLQDIDEEKRKHEEQIQKLRNDNSVKEEAMGYYEKEVQSLHNKKVEGSASLDIIMKEIQSIELKIKRREEERRIMESSLKNREYLFGNHMPALIHKIEEASAQGLFRRKPVGPIGLYLKVHEQKWAFAVERCLGDKLLRSFCCDNMDDRRTLTQIMKNICGREQIPSIIVSPFLMKVHDVKAHKAVSSKYGTVFDAVSSENPVVLNCLIDQKSIENILLIEESIEASNVMMDTPPRNCLCAYTCIGDQLYPSPKYRYYSCTTKNQIRYLQPSFTKEDISAKDREISQLQQNLQEKFHERNVEQESLKRTSEGLKTLGEKIRRLKQEVQLNKQKIEDLEITEDPADVTAQEEELQKHQAIKNKVQEEQKSLVSEYNSKKQKIKGYETEKDKAHDLYKLKQNENVRLLADMQNAEVAYERAVEEKKQCEKTLNSERETLKKAENALESSSQSTQKAVTDALKLCPRVATDAKPQELHSKIKELEKAMNETGKNYDRHAIMKNYVETTNMYKKVQKDIDGLELLIKKLKSILKARQEKYKKIRKHITLQVQYLFNIHMSVRKYSGCLIFDHENETLVIEANPQHTNSSELHQTSSLSGGERSYVTVSLLLALFDVAEIPFHILDEYDVFMDMTNKDQSMKIMMEKAKQQSRNQFIFISPLDLPQSIDSSIVKVHRMPDPETVPRKISKVA